MFCLDSQHTSPKFCEFLKKLLAGSASLKFETGCFDHAMVLALTEDASKATSCFYLLIEVRSGDIEKFNSLVCSFMVLLPPLQREKNVTRILLTFLSRVPGPPVASSRRWNSGKASQSRFLPRKHSVDTPATATWKSRPIAQKKFQISTLITKEKKPRRSKIAQTASDSRARSDFRSAKQLHFNHRSFVIIPK
jgi:hypothetical protein